MDDFGAYERNITDKVKLNFNHSRLSIIDPSPNSNQPFFDNEGLLIFNGMIYNYLEIRKHLEKKKISFLTNSDTEVLLKYLNYYGEEKLQKLDGMWAFAYYNFKIKKSYFQEILLEKSHYFMLMIKIVFILVPA